MDGSLTGLVRALVPRIPLILGTALAHLLSLSETSADWDLRTVLTVKIFRSFVVNPNPSPIGRTQRFTLKDPGVRGRMWIAKVTVPRPEESDVRDQLFKAFDGLKEGHETVITPEIRPVEAEWTGYRAGVDPKAPELDISEGEKYQRLMQEVESDATVLYFHGGALYMMDPATHRPTATRLAQLTSGRCFSVRYRLAPQNPFPAALLDALIAYLSLLHPPPGAFHTAIPPSQVVYAGDSAGGNISMSLLQLILELHRQDPNPTVRWFGKVVSIPLPAGVATNSAWLDLTQSLPSMQTNARYDYLPEPSLSSQSRYPPDDIWPSDPPRDHLYVDGSCLLHPLVSPVTAPSWHRSPPLLFLTGQEMLSDENRHVAAQAASAAVSPVVFYEYQTMPHCFALALSWLPATKHCFEIWADFIVSCVEDPDSIRSKAIILSPKSSSVSVIQELDDPSGLSVFTPDEVRQRMKAISERFKSGKEGEGRTGLLVDVPS